MIDNVLRLSAIFANMMAFSTFALAMVIGIAGTAERTGIACHGCLAPITAALAASKPTASAKFTSAKLALGV